MFKLGVIIASALLISNIAMSGSIVTSEQLAATSQSSVESQSSVVSQSTYEANLVAYKDGFLKIDKNIAIYYSTIDENGTIVSDFPFEPIALLECEDNAVILGSSGQIAIFEDRQWVTGNNLYMDTAKFMTKFEDTYMVLSDSSIATSTDLENWSYVETNFTSSAVGIDLSSSICLAASEDGKMLYTQDGVTWTTFDYNGYYTKYVKFLKISQKDSSVSALGVDEDGLSLVLTSRGGTVWVMQDGEVYSDDWQNPIDTREYQFNDYAWDGSQHMLVGDDGYVLTMPSCTKCNTVTQIEQDNWVRVVYAGGVLAMFSDDGVVKLIDTDVVRQTAISSEETLRQMEIGTPLIDVRTVEEFSESHITGSINIPLSELETTILADYPDKNQTLIFYCGTGMRSQKALDAASELGYNDVYNLGAMEQWSYGFS